MKFTAVLCKSRQMWRRKILFKTKGIYKVDPFHNDKFLASQGIEVIDVTSPDISKHLRKAEKPTDAISDKEKPKFGKRFIAGQGPIYVDESKNRYSISPDEKMAEVYHLTTQQRFTEDIKQACLLTKSLQIDGLPPTIAKSVGSVTIPDQDELVQRLILQSQVWDNSTTRLNRRIDKENIGWKFKTVYGITNSRSASILIHNFIRLALYTAGTHPGVVTDRQLIQKPNLELAYHYRDNVIHINSVNECMVVGKTPLKPVADPNQVEESSNYAMPSMFPISPTIDLEQKEMPVSSLRSQGAFKTILDDTYPKHPHIIFRGMNYNWWPVCNQAYNLMLCFAAAVTEARARFGIDINFDPEKKSHSTTPPRLPEPIVIHNVNTDWQTMNFITYQLNTLDLTNSDGVKNIAWLDTGNSLFDRQMPQPWKGPEHLKTVYDNYNPDVFKKFLAMYLNGVPENSEGLWSGSFVPKEEETGKFKWFNF